MVRRLASGSFPPIADIRNPPQCGPMTEKEQRLLSALAWMCEQYIGSGRADFLDHECMSAGEDAVAALADYGLVEVASSREARWTDAGRALLRGGAD